MEAVNRPELQGEEAESPFQIDWLQYISYMFIMDTFLLIIYTF